MATLEHEIKHNCSSKRVVSCYCIDYMPMELALAPLKNIEVRTFHFTLTE